MSGTAVGPQGAAPQPDYILQIEAIKNTLQLLKDTVEAQVPLLTGLQKPIVDSFDLADKAVNSRLSEVQHMHLQLQQQLTHEIAKVDGRLQSIKDMSVSNEARWKTVTAAVDDLKAQFTAMEARSTCVPGTAKRDEANLMAKKDAANLKKFGEVKGPTFFDWKFDVMCFLEQYDEVLKKVIEWTEAQEKLEDITDSAFQDWLDDDKALKTRVLIGPSSRSGIC